jgi:hypothetical protein
MQYIHRLTVVIVGFWLIWNAREMDRGTPRKLLHSGLGIYILNLLLGGTYILSASDGFIEILSLFHLLLGSASFLCIGFAALLVRNVTHSPFLGEDE